MLRSRWLWAECAAVALAGVASRWAFSLHTGLNLMDWGYLWYGAWRTRLGEIPLRDFQSYDPGRYYLAAALSPVFGDGIVGTRLILALVQWFAIAVALLLLRRAGATRTAALFCAVVLAWWMAPDYKMFDAALSLVAIWAGVNLVTGRTPAADFIAGAYVGIAALFGRNGGVYALLAFVAMLLFLEWKEHPQFLSKRLARLGAGIIAGYSPMWIACLAVPGFFHALLQSVLVNLRSGTNVPLPIPWPWRAHYAGVNFFDAAFTLSVGLCYLLAYAGVAAAIIFLLRSKWTGGERQCLLLASCFVALFYLHHASVRAEIGHFAEAGAPLVVLAFVALIGTPRRLWIPSALAGIAIAAFSIGRLHPVVQRAIDGNWVPRQIEGETIWMDRPNAEVLDAVLEFDRRYNSSGGPILLAPNLPSIYRILRRRSPTWEIYFVLPTTRAEDFVSIRELAGSGARYAILGDIPLDYKDSLRFLNSHPVLYEYIRLTYQEMPGARLPGSYKAYEKR